MPTPPRTNGVTPSTTLGDPWTMAAATPGMIPIMAMSRRSSRDSARNGVWWRDQRKAPRAPIEPTMARAIPITFSVTGSVGRCAQKSTVPTTSQAPMNGTARASMRCSVLNPSISCGTPRATNQRSIARRRSSIGRLCADRPSGGEESSALALARGCMMMVAPMGQPERLEILTREDALR